MICGGNSVKLKTNCTYNMTFKDLQEFNHFVAVLNMSEEPMTEENIQKVFAEIDKINNFTD